ncbi:acyltransferase family protein [Streptomyces nodosus]|uniref:acyltransferase family protein n=1 Tax=Streptomyces nodosus TaxID=40318 RepID=UPI00118541B3|nr:acyltransferase [Streptomyces nodosus]MBB4790827.1 peptidoglycan/LPS O-acetylase OafA/YrhL [Streptomyces nodosus]
MPEVSLALEQRPVTARGEPAPKRIDSIDGLRAVAVAAVMAFHYGTGLGGGFLGVDLFFVISGFVITRLLLTERARTPRPSLGSFWFRRVRRLLPAVLLVVAAVQVWMLLQRPVGLRHTVNAQTLAALTYTSNWYAVLGHVGYWDVTQEQAPLNHLWSLAVEEQFYLVWPLLLFALTTWGTGRIRRPQLLLLAAAAVCYLLAYLLYLPGDPDRAYLGTDTRAGALLLGAAIAFRPGLFSRFCWPAVAVLGWLWCTADIGSAAFYSWQLPLAGLAAAALIDAVAHGERFRKALSCRPLLWLGHRSYGLYLWHWPVWIYLVVNRPEWSQGAKASMALCMSVLLSAIGYRLVERPVRTSPWRPRVLLPVLAVCCATLALVTTAPVAAPVDARRNGPIVTGPNAP